MLTYTKIHAPINGRVADRRIEKGDLASPGQTLLSVYDPLRMRIVAPVPIRLTGQLPLGRAVPVTLDRHQNMTGIVAEIVGEIDPASRTQQVKINLEGAPGSLLPGSFGRIKVPDDPRETVMLPAECVYPVGQLRMIQVANGGRIERRSVRTGQVQDGRVEILSGLAGGERVLLKPIHE